MLRERYSFTPFHSAFFETNLRHFIKNLLLYKVMKSRILSLVVIIIYLFTAYIFGGGELFLRTFLFVLLPFVCIWFGDEMGEITGVSGMRIGSIITEKSPGNMVVFMGWVLLLLPIIILLFQAIAY